MHLYSGTFGYGANSEVQWVAAESDEQARTILNGLGSAKYVKSVSLSSVAHSRMMLMDQGLWSFVDGASKEQSKAGGINAVPWTATFEWGKRNQENEP